MNTSRRNFVLATGFYHLLMSDTFNVYNNKHQSTVHEDMSQPLAHYYISSSHNTYEYTIPKNTILKYKYSSESRRIAISSEISSGWQSTHSSQYAHQAGNIVSCAPGTSLDTSWQGRAASRATSAHLSGAAELSNVRLWFFMTYRRYNSIT